MSLPSPAASGPLPGHWRPFPAPALPAGHVAWLSDAAHDPLWDAFLLSIPLGQFQQSTAWARVKESEGWRTTRCVVTAPEGAIVAGFQVLRKRKGPVEIGYVTKGPVVADQALVKSGQMLSLLQAATRKLKCLAIVVQPPDSMANADATMLEHGFSSKTVDSVISATVWVDLRNPIDAISARYSQSTRKQINKARRSGVVVRAGTPDESSMFFSLMTETCARQNTAPNPGSAAGIRAILDAFASTDSGVTRSKATLLFAEVDRQVIAGMLIIAFGETASLWKIGWSGSHAQLDANKLLYHESVAWSQAQGCTRCDFVGLARATVEQALAGYGESAMTNRSRDVLKLRFGGTPTFLPQARTWSPSRLARLLIRVWSTYRKN